jgi:hypothetical protein
MFVTGRTLFIIGGFPLNLKPHKLKVSDYLEEYPEGD